MPLKCLLHPFSAGQCTLINPNAYNPNAYKPNAFQIYHPNVHLLRRNVFKTKVATWATKKCKLIDSTATEK